MNKKILVTGATGTIGKALVAQLRDAGVPFIAAARDAAKAAETLGLPAGQTVHFDFSEPGTFAAAVTDVDRVFLLGPPVVLQMDKLLTPFIDFLRSAGISRIVYVSALSAENMGPELNFHTAIEAKLAADGFDYTILRPSFFAQNFRTYEWDNITKYNMVYMPAGAGKAGFVDVADIAAVAVKALTESGHGGQRYELTGPEALSYHDAAKLLTEVTGKPIGYPAPSPEQFTETLRSAGVPDFVAPYMISVYSIIARDEADKLSGDIARVTGRQPTPLKAVLERDFA